MSKAIRENSRFRRLVYPSMDKVFDKTTMLAGCIVDEKINEKRRPIGARKHHQKHNALAEIVLQKAASDGSSEDQA